MQIDTQRILGRTEAFVGAVHKPAAEAREAKKGNLPTFNNLSFAMAHTAIEDHTKPDLLTQGQVTSYAKLVFTVYSNLAKNLTPFLTSPERDLRQILVTAINNPEAFDDLSPEVAGGFADILELLSGGVSNSILGNIKQQEVQQFQALSPLRNEFDLLSMAGFFRSLTSAK